MVSVRPSVNPSQNFEIKLQSLPARTVGWPSGSLITPVLLYFLPVGASAGRSGIGSRNKPWDGGRDRFSQTDRYWEKDEDDEGPPDFGIVFA